MGSFARTTGLRTIMPAGSTSATFQVKSTGNMTTMGLTRQTMDANVANLSQSNLVELGKLLLAASGAGDTKEVVRLMSKGAPMTTDWLGTSPLHLAAQHGHEDVAEILLRSGCSRDAKTKVEKTPLHVAAQEGHASICELLLKNGADVDTKDMVSKHLFGFLSSFQFLGNE